MATMATIGNLAVRSSGSGSEQTSSTGNRAPRKDFRRRVVSREAGRAMEMLGHAIEYLADEFALECRTRKVAEAGKHAQVQAIELLMTRSREVYFSCPVMPTMAERLRAFVTLQRA